jgi:hypothetical protein
MSKVIGVTPGPVKQEVMDERDVEQLINQNAKFGVSTLSNTSDITFESVPNDDYLNVVVQYSVYVGDTKFVDSDVMNYLVPAAQLESDRAVYRTNISLNEIVNDDVNDVTYYINGAGVLDISVISVTEEEVTTISGTGTLSGFAIYHNGNNNSVVRIDVESITLE